MLDEIAIQQTLSRFTDGTSRGDIQQALSTFLADGVYESSGVRLRGYAAIEAAAVAYVAQFSYVVQVSAPALIVVDGDKATARSVIRESCRYAHDDAVLEVVGTYQDQLIRTAEGWKISHRTFSPIGSYRLPVLPEPGHLAHDTTGQK
jgi:hypothetical protein